MPFSKTKRHRTEEYWTEHFEKFLKPRIQSAINGIEVYRSKITRGSIINNIINSLVTDDIVLADLTDHNPNVYWELGIRHSFTNGTILVAEEKTKFPFDISPIGVHRYKGQSALDASPG